MILTKDGILRETAKSIEPAYEFAGNELRERLRCHLDALASDYIWESPAEFVFAYWWEVFRRYDSKYSDTLRFLALKHQKEVSPIGSGHRYRLDFALDFEDVEFLRMAELIGLKPPLVAIEIDGHEFHERTKEQVIYRDQRDRDLQGEGWRVIHFSGAAVFRNPEAVAREAIDFAHSEVCRYYNRTWQLVLRAVERAVA